MALANLNSPTQIVVSGEEAGVERLMELASEAGAAKTRARCRWAPPSTAS